MQTDLFESGDQARIRDLMRKREQLQAELSHVSAAISETVRENSSISISHDGTLQLCEFSFGRYAIYKQPPPDLERLRGQEVREFFLVDLEQLYAATREILLRKEARVHTQAHA